MKALTFSILLYGLVNSSSHHHGHKDHQTPVYKNVKPPHMHKSQKFLDDRNGQTCDDWGIVDMADHIYAFNNKWGKYTATGDSW